MSRQNKQALGLVIVIGVVVVIWLMIGWVNRYAAWVLATPAVAIMAVVVLRLRHPAVRSVTAGGLDAVAQWWKAWRRIILVAGGFWPR